MSKTWGVARFYGMGSMEYHLESGAWLPDGKLYDGAPIRLFESMEAADAAAEDLPRTGGPHGVQFMVDSQNRVVTAKSSKAFLQTKNLQREHSTAKEQVKAEFTIFEDSSGYWGVAHALEAAAIAMPEKHRASVYPTKIGACRHALELALQYGATELHLHGMGATTSIKREAAAKGIKAHIYWPSITTKIAAYVRPKK